jgi:imidazolonepropionase-like amidohydrolase
MKSIFGTKIYTGTSLVENAYLVFNNTTISGISKKKTGTVLGRFPVITPAFIDPHTHIGMARSGEPGSEAEANDQLESIMALPDALDSVQMDDSAFRDAVEMGVLYSCVVPGSGNIISGHSAVIRNYATNTSSALVARAGIKAAFGYNPMSASDWKGSRPTTRMGAMAVLRKRLDDVARKVAKYRRATARKKKDISFSAEEAVLRDILAGKIRLRCHVHKNDDIVMILRLVDEYKLKVVIEHAMSVNTAEIFKELKRRRIPVTYGPIDAFAYKVELKHENWRNVRYLVDSGVQFGLMTDHPVTPARQILVQTRWFTRAGLTEQQAIELVSRQNARILGIDKFLGSLSRGKWASFICWNGNPFDITKYPEAVYGEGNMLFEA